jgi:hypothetical protein
LGLDYPTAIVNRGYIQRGMGGGGGGGTGFGRKCGRTQRGCDECSTLEAAGGGGGGGTGYPPGNGGDNGGNATETERGAGGAGSINGTTSTDTNCRVRARGGDGGRGGKPGVTLEAADNGETGGDRSGNAGGPRGLNGYAIILNGSGSIRSYTELGTGYKNGANGSDITIL